MAKIKFSKFQLLKDVDDRGERILPPKKDDFNGLEDLEKYVEEKNYYDIKIIREEDYVWFVFDYGNPEPRDPILIDINTGEKTENQRTLFQTELLQQFFALYFYSTGELYLSNSQKKNFFICFLKNKLSIDFFVKQYFKDIDEFYNIISEVKSISFTNANDLFGANSSKRQALVDLTGIDAPKCFTIKADYGGRFVSGIKSFITSLTEERRDCKLENLTIRGRDESGMELIYNIDTFCEKIEFDCKKDNETKKYNSDLILEELLRKILK